jgi:hypothetical protein
MTNTAPLEILSSPFEVYVATSVTAEPDLKLGPTASWTLLGTNGKLNQAEGGVMVNSQQSITEFFTEGYTGPIKANRDREGFKVKFSLADLTPAHFTKALTGTAPTSQGSSGSSAGYDVIGLYRGIDVSEVSLLLRGPSSKYASGYSHFYIPRAYQSGQPNVQLSKKGLAIVEFEFTALVYASAASPDVMFGVFRAQTTA